MDYSEYPFISVIIPTYNESEYILRCLESLKNLDYPKSRYEIIVVDNGSTDDTVSICRKLISNIYICPDLNVSGLRNYGVKQSHGTILAFIDADCLADTDWLLNSVKSLQKEPCVSGSKVNIPKKATWIEKVWFSQRITGRQEVQYINSGNLIVPAAIFNKIGGFSQTLRSGEDSDFCHRARKYVKIISDDSIKVTHLGNPKTLHAFIKREIWHGIGAIELIGWTRYDKPFIGTIFFALFSFIQLIGIVCFVIQKDSTALIYATSAIIVLLIMTATYRLKYETKAGYIPQLAFLYYFYYLGRTLSFVYSLKKRRYLRTR